MTTNFHIAYRAQEEGKMWRCDLQFWEHLQIGQDYLLSAISTDLHHFEKQRCKHIKNPYWSSVLWQLKNRTEATECNHQLSFSHLTWVQVNRTRRPNKLNEGDGQRGPVISNFLEDIYPASFRYHDPSPGAYVVPTTTSLKKKKIKAARL